MRLLVCSLVLVRDAGHYHNIMPPTAAGPDAMAMVMVMVPARIDKHVRGRPAGRGDRLAAYPSTWPPLGRRTNASLQPLACGQTNSGAPF